MISHRRQFFELRHFANKNNVAFPWEPKNMSAANIDAALKKFEAAWDSAKKDDPRHVMTTLKDFVRGYETSARTARQFREAAGLDLKISEIRKIHTHDLYNKYKNQIDAYYQAQIDNGMKKADAHRAVSQYWFNSD